MTRVLLIEDNTDAREALRALLELDGYEVARRMKALPAPPSVMIALTGYSEPEDRQRATEAGFAAHLVKPVDPDGLSRLLARLETRGPGSRG